MKIKQLSSAMINLIAAGEVVERPSSVVKELVENAIDAGARKISIKLETGGSNAIIVQDDGCGMSPEEIALAVQRHTTSKLPDDNLVNIQFFGFRGEALPSIASVSKMKITSRTKDMDNSWCLSLEAGEQLASHPANHPIGTTIEIRDLFFSTPARLRFLRSERTELDYCRNILTRIAISHPNINFAFYNNNQLLFDTQSVDSSLMTRIDKILGKEFADNSIAVEVVQNNAKISGRVSLPTLHRRTTDGHYIFVNNRSVRDKVLQMSLKAAYADVMERDRQPIVVLFLDVSPQDVDVNVHPSKAEVRFHDNDSIRRLVIGAIKDALHQASHHARSSLGEETLAKFNVEEPPSMFLPRSSYSSAKRYDKFPPQRTQNSSPLFMQAIKDKPEPCQHIHHAAHDHNHPMGHAVAQIFDNYIISQNEDSMVIVDQHAVHERIVYEEMKQSKEEHGITRQVLLIPEMVECSELEIELLNKHQEDLQKLGILYEICDRNLIVRELPAMFKNNLNVKQFMRDIIDEIKEIGNELSASGMLEHIMETSACHNSIRSGKNLSLNEMNALLRKMEKTPQTGQCNHGRPTYIKLHKKDIDRLFERT